MARSPIQVIVGRLYVMTTMQNRTFDVHPLPIEKSHILRRISDE